MKELVRQVIMNEFWTRTLKRVATFPGCDPSMVTNYMLKSICTSFGMSHCGRKRQSENKFHILSNEALAPRSNDMQRQLQRLQIQLRMLLQQIHGREPPSETGGMPRHNAPMQYTRLTSHNGNMPRFQQLVDPIHKHPSHQCRVKLDILFLDIAHNVTVDRVYLVRGPRLSHAPHSWELVVSAKNGNHFPGAPWFMWNRETL